MTYWLVALGGALGSVARVGLSDLIQRRWGGAFPAGTLAVNLAGSFVLGLIVEYALSSTAVSREARVLLTAGFCGGFTTFSTFALETVRLAQDGDHVRAAGYVAASVLLGLLALAAGLFLARALLALRRGV